MDIQKRSNECLHNDEEQFCDVLKYLIITDFKHLTHLDLSNRYITDLPDEFGSLIQLKELDLSKNYLNEIPRCFEYGIPSITNLNLSNNQITQINGTPKCASVLKVLHLHANMISEIPKWLFNQTLSLEELYIGENVNLFIDAKALKHIYHHKKLTILSIESCQTEVNNNLIFQLPRLKKLVAGNSKLAQQNIILNFPNASFNDLTKIVMLNLENVTLTKLESSINLLQCLESINLSNNYLEDLPIEFCELKNLRCCQLSGNLISSLPENIVALSRLKFLQLDSNSLTKLPSLLEQIETLEELDLYNNNLEEFNLEIPSLKALDLAKNNMEEPATDNYKKLKSELRKQVGRYDGRKTNVSYSYNDLSESDEECDPHEPATKHCDVIEEDWESDDYWEPYIVEARRFVRKKSNNNNSYLLTYKYGQFDD